MEVTLDGKNSSSEVIWNPARLWWFKHAHMHTKALKSAFCYCLKQSCHCFIFWLLALSLPTVVLVLFNFNLIHLFDIILGEAYRSATCTEDNFGESSIFCLLYFLIFFLFITIIITLVNMLFLLELLSNYKGWRMMGLWTER